MGLGFCRFVERSRLYPPPGVDTESVATSGQKDGPPAASATLTTDDYRLVGPGDRVKFFAEVRIVDPFKLPFLIPLKSSSSLSSRRPQPIIHSITSKIKPNSC